MPLVEWPAAATLQQAASAWSTARLVIAPHGAGGTNIIFMPPGSTFVEIVASDQHGRVYGSLARQMGLRYVPCVYNRSEPRFKPQLWEGVPNDNFVVDVAWLLECMQARLNATRSTAASPMTEIVWARLDRLLDPATRSAQA